LDCGVQLKVLQQFLFGKVLNTRVVPLPYASESLDWRRVCKNALQNLEPKELRVKTLIIKSLRGF
jgi:hypothetical protein